MKKCIVILLLLIPTTLFAQNHQGMNQENMQEMMMAMQKMQECMAGIDQSQLEVLGMHSEEVGREIDALCQQGKKDAAQAKALAWSKELREMPVVKQIIECSKLYQGPGVDPAIMDPTSDFTKDNICDTE